METEQQLLYRTLDSLTIRRNKTMAKPNVGAPAFKDLFTEKVYQETRDKYFPEGFGNEVMSSKNS